jgi:large subunit ribosomal protein L29
VKAEKVREMSLDELATRENELSEQLFRLRLQKAVGQIDNASKLQEIRRDIARVKTFLRQKRGIAR